MNRHIPQWKRYIQTPIGQRNLSGRGRFGKLPDVDTLPQRLPGEPFREYLSRMLR